MPVPAREELPTEKIASAFWLSLLDTFLCELSVELSLVQPSHPLSLALAHAAGAAHWEGECAALCDSFVESSASAYMDAAGAPFLAVLCKELLLLDPLPADRGALNAASLALLEGSEAVRAAGAAAAEAAAAACARSARAVRTVVLSSATTLQGKALETAAAEQAVHGGAGVEEEPKVSAADFLKYVKSGGKTA